MARSSRRPSLRREPDHPVMAAASALGGVIARNPTLVGGSTAFLVALSFVSANALWYQPFAHPAAFFPTRAIERGDATPAPSETTIFIERPEPATHQIEGDPATKAVQAILRELDLYQGPVDGLSGPNTRRAVEAYQESVGLPVTGLIDAELLDQLDTGPTAAITPRPSPRPQSIEAIIQEPAPARFDGEDNSPGGSIRKIQAGLREFGRKDIDIDGVLGSRTRAAIKEFQALFGLPQTGEADQAVFAKMREENLID